MGLTERKLTDWTQPVSSLDDRPQMTASALKAAFDSNTNQIKPALNGVIDDLTGTGGAGNVGVEAITGVTGVSVQAMLASLKALIDLCDTTEEIDGKLDLKADKTTTDKLVKTITLDARTGVFTIKTDDGTTTTIDTMLEKIPVSCYLDGQEFVLVLDDGTEQRADLSAFLTPTEFTDSPTIDFSVSGDTVTAVIKAGSVTLEMLESTVMATLESYKTAAEKAAANAAASETNAGAYRDQAQQSASAAASSASGAGANATLSESWAVGGTGTREGEDVNNAKYYAQQSAASATTAGQKADAAMEHADSAETSQKAAEAAAARAEQAAEDAEAIVGGDFIPNSQKGAPGGVATLGADGKVEPEQLPAALGADAVTVSGGGELDMAESLGVGPYTIEFTEETSSGGGSGDYADKQLSNLDTPQAAFANLGAGVRPNLLDNGDFRAGHIVNQWGRTSVSAGGQFLFDRWRTYRYVSGTASVTENGVNLAGNFDFGETIESSRIPNTPNFRVTISAMFSDGSFVSKTGTLGNTGAAEMFQIAVTQYTNLQFIRNWNTGVDLFFFQLLSEDNITPIAAKLETGSTQTLAYQDETGAWQLLPQPESDYAIQKLKCMRYYQKFDWLGGGTNFAPIRVFLPLPFAMRITPTASFTQDGTGTVTVTPRDEQSVDITVQGEFAVVHIALNANL